METKKIKLALLRMKNNESATSNSSNKSKTILKYLGDRNLKSLKSNNSVLNSYINAYRKPNNILLYPKNKNNYLISPEKNLNFSSELLPNEKNIDLLKENLLKTKEMYNEQSKELFKLKIKYKKLYKLHEENLKTLQLILEKAGVNININYLNKNEIINIINNCDFSNFEEKEKQNLKEKHLITVFKTKILEYQYLLDKKDDEISAMKNSSRISKLSKIINDNASKSLENINLFQEKQKLNEKIIHMENAMGSLTDRCQQLEKNENRNINNIGELQNKIKNLIDEIDLKNKKIEKMNIIIN